MRAARIAPQRTSPRRSPDTRRPLAPEFRSRPSPRQASVSSWLAQDLPARVRAAYRLHGEPLARSPVSAPDCHPAIRPASLSQIWHKMPPLSLSTLAATARLLPWPQVWIILENCTTTL